MVRPMQKMPCHNSGSGSDRIQHMDRKAKKPLMEKRRRARINKCLGDLKNLLLEHLKRDPSQTSKLEKADILEMTVTLLRRMQQDQLMRASMFQPSIKDRFLDGWRDCAAQVTHYANTVDGMPVPMKEALQRHLADRYRALQQTVPTAPHPLMPTIRQRLPAITPGVFPPPPGGLYPAPVAFAAAAAQWRATMIPPVHLNAPAGMVLGMVPVQQQKSIIDESSGAVVVGPMMKHELEKEQEIGDDGQRSVSRASTTRMLASTPACFDEEEDEMDDGEDSASCSSSEATNESDMPERDGAKESVWRPW